MRLATLKFGTPRTESEKRDGQLVVVAPDGLSAASVQDPKYASLLNAIDDWAGAEPVLKELAAALADGTVSETIDLSNAQFMAPLPRTFAFLDGSAYIQHIILVRKARNAEPPDELRTVPLMYQGISDYLLGPNESIELIDPEFGLDFEAELAVVLDRVPRGTKSSDAGRYVKLFLLMNDVSLRNLIPREMKTGFGFLQSKPSSAFAPFAVTPDELGNAWKDGRVHLPMISRLNGSLFGQPDAGEMHFSFFDLIEHAARTRDLAPGTIIGSGTISNEDSSVGSSCLAEKRMLEKINSGEISTPFMKVGDSIEIDMLDAERSIFGKISQIVVQAQ